MCESIFGALNKNRRTAILGIRKNHLSPFCNVDTLYVVILTFFKRGENLQSLSFLMVYNMYILLKIYLQILIIRKSLFCT